jgi:hypothetical protein
MVERNCRLPNLSTAPLTIPMATGSVIFVVFFKKHFKSKVPDVHWLIFAHRALELFYIQIIP